MQRENETAEGLRRRKERQRLQKLHQNAQRLLRPLAVANPYAPKLTFLDTRPRNRRDHMRYLVLIRAVALLHQYQRKVKTMKTDQGELLQYIEVEPSDIKIANRLVNNILGNCLDDLSPQARRLLQLLWQMVQEQCKQQGIKQHQFHFTRKMVREYTGWGDTQLKVHLAQLVDQEYLIICRGAHSQRYFYQMLYQGEGQDGGPFLMGLIDPEKL